MCPTRCWKCGTVVECLPITCDTLSSIPSTGHTQKCTVTGSLWSKVVVQPLWQLRWSPYDLNGFHRELFKGESWMSLGVDTKFPFSLPQEQTSHLPQEQTSHLYETRMTAAPGLSNLRLFLQEKTGTHSCLAHWFFCCVAASTHCKNLQKAFNQVVWLDRCHELRIPLMYTQLPVTKKPCRIKYIHAGWLSATDTHNINTLYHENVVGLLLGVL